MRDAMNRAKEAASATLIIERSGARESLELTGSDLRELLEDRDVSLILMSREL